MKNKLLVSLNIKFLYTNILVNKYIDRLGNQLRKTNTILLLPIYKLIKIYTLCTSHYFQHNSKNYVNHIEIFALRLFKKMVSWITPDLEQRSVIKFLMTEKCKPCDIYWWMSDGYGEIYLSQEMFRTGQNWLKKVEIEFTIFSM